MASARTRLGPGVPDLAALGARWPEDLFRPEGLETWPRAEELATLPGDGRAVRLPLPGTPDADGRVHEAPRGAGTGHVLLRLFRTGPLRGAAVRFGRPRSGSEAERRWNLACRLRASGVATPDPLAVAALGLGLWSRTSALLVRELDTMLPFDRFVHTEVAEEERRLALEAVGRALVRLERSGVVLPALRPDGVLVQLRDGEACGAGAPVGGALHRLPGVAVADLRRGFEVGAPDHPRAAEACAWLRSELEALVRGDEAELLAPGEPGEPGPVEPALERAT